MRVSTSAYYAWVNSPDRQDRAKAENELKEKIKQIFYENKQVYSELIEYRMHSVNLVLRRVVIK
jgi:hypothetical protein